MNEKIVLQNNPVLRKVAKPILKKDMGSLQLRRLIEHMRKLLAKEEYGVGLAAPQVGVSWRLFIVAGEVFLPPSSEEDESEERKKKLPAQVFINPEALRSSRSKKEMSEGCLSVPGLYGRVVRHEKITIQALDEKGVPVTRHASGLLAHIFQHELDHLNGILYTDKATHLQPMEESARATHQVVERRSKKNPKLHHG